MRKVTFIKLGAIGDVVMAMTAVRRLKDLEPSTEVTWVCSELVCPLIERHLPSVRVIPVDERKLYSAGFSYGQLGSAQEVLKTRVKLGLARANLLAIGYHDRRYGLLGLGAGKSTRWFSPTPGAYHPDAYLAVLGGNGSALPLHPRDLLPPSAESGTGIVLAPGGAKNLLRDDALRRYPVEHYVTLARMALDQGKPVTIMGSSSDEWVRPHFEGLPVRFEIGTVRLEEIPLWLRQFERLITHDSGPMHLGFMSGIPVTALFGSTRADEKVPRNYAANGSIIIQGGKGLACAPCYDGKNYADCSHQRCLKEVVPSPDFFG